MTTRPAIQPPLCTALLLAAAVGTSADTAVCGKLREAHRAAARQDVQEITDECGRQALGAALRLSNAKLEAAQQWQNGGCKTASSSRECAAQKLRLEEVDATVQGLEESIAKGVALSDAAESAFRLKKDGAFARFAESVFLHFGSRGDMYCSDDPQKRVNLQRAAQAAQRTFLDRTQQLRAQGCEARDASLRHHNYSDKRDV